MVTPDSPAFLDAVREAHEPEQQAPATLTRRVIEETEACQECRCIESPDNPCGWEPDPECPTCKGTGQVWKVVSRTVQVGVPFEEQAAHAYIKGLHEHIRKAAKSVAVAADMLDKAGQTKHAAETRKVVEAILEPVKGQD